VIVVEPLSEAEAGFHVGRLAEKASVERARLDEFHAYFAGHHRRPYEPPTSTAEFRVLARRAVTNLVPLVVGSQVERLFVDGYRPDATDDEDSRAWLWWQANSLDAKQKALYETVAVNGYGWMMVLPGDPFPWMMPASPRAWYAELADSDDDWPRFALRVVEDRAKLIDSWGEYWLSKRDTRWVFTADRPPRPHGLGVCPFVRYTNTMSLDATNPIGEVEPVIPVQDRLNQTVFDLLVAQSYAGTPQRWIAGIEDADLDDDSLRAAMVKRVWMLDSPASQVGQLPEADLSNLVGAINNTLRVYGLKSKTPPHYLLGEMVNLSGEALTAADTSLSMKIKDRQTTLGESHERVFRLAARAAGDVEAESDVASQVIWRDTDPRALSATVDALSKMVSPDGLQVPPEMAWPMIPGWTQQDVNRARAMRDQGDSFAQLQAELERQFG